MGDAIRGMRIGAAKAPPPCRLAQEGARLGAQADAKKVAQMLPRTVQGEQVWK